MIAGWQRGNTRRCNITHKNAILYLIIVNRHVANMEKGFFDESSKNGRYYQPV